MSDDLVAILAELEPLEAEARITLKHTVRHVEIMETIKTRRLYVARNRTWAEYIDQHWKDQYTRAKIDRLIETFHVQHALEASGATVKKLSNVAAKSLKRIPYRKQLYAWDQAQAKMKAEWAAKEEAAKKTEGDGQAKKSKPLPVPEPTSAQVEEAVREIEKETSEPIELIRLAASDFKQLSKAAVNLGKQIEALADNDWGAELVSRIPEVTAAIGTLKDVLKQAAPYCMCYCARGCRMCRGRKPRWICWSLYRSAPKEMQAKITEHA